MKLPKIIIFDVGGTIVSGKWQSFMKGYEYLYNEVLNVKETYEEYIAKIPKGSIAYWVKLADMKDHLTLTDTLTEKLKEKYLRGLAILL